MTSEFKKRLNVQAGKHLGKNVYFSSKPVLWYNAYVRGMYCRPIEEYAQDETLRQAYLEGFRWFLEEFEP